VKLSGLIVPLITPLNEDETLDEQGLERMVEHVIAGGVSGIFLLGSSGEVACLSPAVKERLVRAVSAQAAGRVMVLVGISHTSTRLALEQGQRLVGPGVDAVVATGPYYFWYSQPELASHFLTLAHTLQTPLVLYNIPQLVKVKLEPDTVARLAEDPLIVGLKDSAGDMDAFDRFLDTQRNSSGFSVSQGSEPVAAESILRGADGIVLGLSNVAPRLCRQIYDAAKAGDRPGAEALQEQLMHLFPINRYKSFLAGLKTGAHLLGICKPIVSAPFEPLDEDQVASVRQRMVDLQLLLA
jgi:4-hydroxy-tetrahydrodipicolinate synthase